MRIILSHVCWGTSEAPIPPSPPSARRGSPSREPCRGGRPRQQPAHPQYANYWAPLTRKRHIPPHSAQPQHTKYWAPRTRKRHQQEHRPQRPTESSNPTQHAKGRTGDCPGPRKGTTTRRNVTQGVWKRGANDPPPPRTFLFHPCEKCACAPVKSGTGVERGARHVVSATSSTSCS